MAVGRVFPNEIDRIFNAPGGPIGKEARQVALATARTASILAGQKLGKHPGDRPRTKQYENSFRVTVAGRSTQFIVSNNKKYAAALEEGGRPHAIRARRVTNLKFKDRSGRWRTVKTVRHPGNPAFRILTTASAIVIRQRYGTARIVN